ncbi:hypothetical protein ABZ372_46850, partial [Streptomyces sp. NPDC005921]
MEQPVPIAGPSGSPAAPRPLRQRLTIPVLAFGGILMAVMQTVVVPLLPLLPRSPTDYVPEAHSCTTHIRSTPPST